MRLHWFNEYDASLYPDTTDKGKNITFTDEKGTGSYTGDMLHGKRHGSGVMVWKNYTTQAGQSMGKVKYEGAWKQNMMQGLGKITYGDGHWYEGQWETSHMHGRGKYQSKKGAIFEGYWVMNIYKGREGERVLLTTKSDDVDDQDQL